MKRAAGLLPVVALLAGGAAFAGPLVSRVELGKARALVGEPVAYRAWVTVGKGVPARWLQPDRGAAFDLYDLRARRARGGAEDTLILQGRLRAWYPGTLALPGVGLELGERGSGQLMKLPTTRLVVGSVLPARGQPQLRPWRVPLAAPWWERIPWRWVVLGALLLAALVVLVRRAFSKRRKPAPLVAAAAVDPVREALEALRALQSQNLPERGRFAEHAFRLGRILRRFLEATIETTLPGDTTPELVGHLEQARLEVEELRRMHALLREWDQLKFARGESSLEQALRHERMVEAFVRRPSGRQEAA